MKRRLAVVAAVFALLLPIFLFSSAQLTIVRAACSTQTGTFPPNLPPARPPVAAGDTVTLSVPGSPSVQLNFPDGTSVSAPNSASGTTSVAGVISWIIGRPFTSWSLTICSPGGSSASSGVNNPPKPAFNDDRLNNWDAHETSALYCIGDGSVRVYVPAEPKWRIAFTVSPAELAAVPKNPTQNTLIKSGNGATLYRLTGGALQVNTPALEPSKGDYLFVFQDCPVPANQSSSGAPSGSSNSAPSFQLGDGSSFGK